MIKRRFYKFEHGDKDAPSESSSSSDFEPEVEATEESEDEEEEEEDENDNDDTVAEARGGGAPSSSSSGYESEDSSANELNLDSSGFPTSYDDGGSRNDRERMESPASGEGNTESVNVKHNTVPEVGDIPSDVPDCVVKRKSVFKCKLCPRIVCLTEDSLKAHLKSKRHARSEKLLKEGRLKLMLDNDGKVDGEADPENNSSSQISAKIPVIAKRQHIHSKKFKKKRGKHFSLDSAMQSEKNPSKKRRRKGY